jgi:hypothetical protein
VNREFNLSAAADRPRAVVWKGSPCTAWPKTFAPEAPIITDMVKCDGIRATRRHKSGMVSALADEPACAHREGPSGLAEAWWSVIAFGVLAGGRRLRTLACNAGRSWAF